jgi:hypothetical protein
LRPLDDDLSIRESGNLDRLDDEHGEVHLRVVILGVELATRRFGSNGLVLMTLPGGQSGRPSSRAPGTSPSTVMSWKCGTRARLIDASEAEMRAGATRPAGLRDGPIRTPPQLHAPS